MTTLLYIGNSMNVATFKFEGKSTDVKPTGKYKGKQIPNASTYTCVDTAQVYWYDKDEESWIEIGGDTNGD